MAQSILEESKKAKRGIFRFVFKKKFLIIAGSILITLGGAYYFFGPKTSGTTAVVTQKQATVKRGDIKIAVQSSGKVVAKDGVVLSFPVTGNLEIDNVFVKEGDRIKKGDKIASVKTETMQFDLRNAYASYQAALANFNTKVSPATASDISKSKAAIDQAQVSLDQANISLDQTKSSAAQNIANAQLNVQTAENNLKINTDVNDSAIVHDAYSSLISTIKSVNISLQKILRDSDSVLGVDNTMINSDFKAVLGAKNLSSYGTAKDSYAAAKTAASDLDSSVSGLSEANSAGVDAAAKKADNALVVFQNHLTDTQTLLESTITSVNLIQSQLDSFKSMISSDRTSVNSSLSSVDNSIQSVADAKTNLNQFQLAYDKAVRDLATAKSQSDQNISNATISVRSRQISLDQAKNDYNTLVAPTPESDLASARSQLTSAAVAVDKAKYNVDQATLVSPIDGVVAQLNYKVGDIIVSDATNKAMATIINNDTLFIEANIEEADVSKLKVGEKAQVTFDAIDGVNLTGEVSFISLTSQTSSNGIVTYLVRVILNNAGASQVREGMTASIDFITAQAVNVLSIPVQAVHNIGGKPSVEKADGTIVNVVTGFTDGKSVEISSGLKDGDAILY